MTIRSNAADYDSLGRNQQGDVIVRSNGKRNLTDEYAVNIPGVARPLWMKNLRAWDTGAYSDYKVLKMTNKHGQTIMILYNCGNIVTVGRYTPPAPPAPPAPADQTPAMNILADCNTISWQASDPNGSPRVRIYIAVNTGNPTNDWNSKGPFAHVSQAAGSGTTNNGSWSVPSSYRNTNTYRVFGVVSNKLPSGTMDNTNFVRANPAQGIVFGPCTTATPPPPTEPDFCPDLPGIQASEEECLPCENSATPDDVTACLVRSKTAANETQNIANADGTVAKGGDEITYTLSVKNTGKVTVKDFVIEENIADVLDYASIADFNGSTLDGVILRWPAVDLSPGETVRRRLEIRVKDPIPETPISASDPGRFDLVMNNVYGNSINIRLPQGVVKAAEMTTKTLPNTGPGESIAAAVGFTVAASYFFARSRLFAKEMDIVRTDYATTGGY